MKMYIFIRYFRFKGLILKSGFKSLNYSVSVIIIIIIFIVSIINLYIHKLYSYIYTNSNYPITGTWICSVIKPALQEVKRSHVRSVHENL